MPGERWGGQDAVLHLSHSSVIERGCHSRPGRVSSKNWFSKGVFCWWVAPFSGGCRRPQTSALPFLGRAAGFMRPSQVPEPSSFVHPWVMGRESNQATVSTAATLPLCQRNTRLGHHVFYSGRDRSLGHGRLNSLVELHLIGAAKKGQRFTRPASTSPLYSPCLLVSAQVWSQTCLLFHSPFF